DINYKLIQKIKILEKKIHNDTLKLLEYERLRKNGLIYLEKRTEGMYTAKEFIMQILPESKYYMLDFKEEEQKNLSTKIPFDKRLAKSYYSSITGLLGYIFKEEHDGCKASRFKKNITSKQFISGQSGNINEYPYEYIVHVENFLKKYPIEFWWTIPEHIVEDGDNYVRCTKCKVKFETLGGMKKHCNTNKHNKLEEEELEPEPELEEEELEYDSDYEYIIEEYDSDIEYGSDYEIIEE
ncbi:MAG: hypothetical protein ACTSQA_09155, partial [Candidatus Heimdallarchaeaceae archaeon]